MIKNPTVDRKEPYIYFISNLKDARAIAEHYLKRWQIECCFKNLKTNGFNIEDINFQDDQKIELMMALLAMIYLIAIREGIIRNLLKPIRIKKYKKGKSYLSISIFRLGYAIIQPLFDNCCTFIRYIQQILREAIDRSLDTQMVKNV